MASEPLAEAAIAAGRPPVVRLREDCARRRERVVAELFGRGFEVDADLIDLQWRQRIVTAARRFEHVAVLDLASLQIARLTRDAKFVLRAIVVRLELRVAPRPLEARRSRW